MQPEHPSPNKILHIKSVPPPGSAASQAFEKIFSSQEGYVATRQFGHFAFVEYSEVAFATSVQAKFNGHKYHANAPPLRIEFDRDAGKPKKRKAEEPPSLRLPHPNYPLYPSQHPSPDYGISREYEYHPRPDKRSRLEYPDQNIRHRYYEDSVIPHPPDLSRHDRGDRGDRERRKRSRSPRRDSSPRRRALHSPPRLMRPNYYDPYMFLRAFLPYWETTSRIPFDPLGRMGNDVLRKACPTLFVRQIPLDSTKREIENLFSFLPNFLKVRLVAKPTEAIAFVDFEDAASAYVAMIIMQGFKLEGTPVHIEYDKTLTQRTHNDQ